MTDSYGRAISSAKLTLTNASTGEVSAVYTNTFGYYTFKGLPVGDFFVMTVQHRRYLFVSGSVSFSLEDNIAGLDFQASR
ncbi:MAG: carboxypeptidase-like regulatory domain-containing protein [Pyrinomonadaceae bacterium]